jgi:5,5'-dehydrodivanillate O-demethylase
MNSFSSEFMYRVPIDDAHTLHVFFTSYPRSPGATARQKKVPYYIAPPSVDDRGLPIWSELDNNGGQDAMAWIGQGEIVDRTKEKLADSDRGIILWRELLSRQLRIVEDGGEPMNVFRDPVKNVRINVPPRSGEALEWSDRNGYMRRTGGPYKHSVIVRQMVEQELGPGALAGPVTSRVLAQRS